MPMIKLDQMSLPELHAHFEAVRQALESRHEQEKAAAKTVLEAKARELGFSIQDLFDAPRRRRPGTSKSADGRSSVAPKYANPTNPSQTWTGRGKAPNWLKALEADGKSRTDFLIAS